MDTQAIRILLGNAETRQSVETILHARMNVVLLKTLVGKENLLFKVQNQKMPSVLTRELSGMKTLIKKFEETFYLSGDLNAARKIQRNVFKLGKLKKYDLVRLIHFQMIV